MRSLLLGAVLLSTRGAFAGSDGGTKDAGTSACLDPSSIVVSTSTAQLLSDGTFNTYSCGLIQVKYPNGTTAWWNMPNCVTAVTKGGDGGTTTQLLQTANGL